MESFLDFYHYLPYRINPSALSFGPFSIGWYSLMYLAGFITVYCLVAFRIHKGEIALDKKILINFLFYAFIGLIVGARLGYVLFYNFSYFWHSPLLIISPFDSTTGQFIGIYGLSFHGGLLGIILASAIFCRRYKINFWIFSNSIAPAIPAGYFFGRIGNFLNGELYGRITQKIWGMYFPAGGFANLRHPSQLYEALLEGLLLFFILWNLRNNEKFKKIIFPLFIIGYSLARIIAEFFRLPDEQIGFIFRFFTLGQILSLIFLLAGAVMLWLEKNRKEC